VQGNTVSGKHSSTYDKDHDEAWKISLTAYAVDVKLMM